MLNSNRRFKPNQKYTVRKFNKKVNTIKRVNTVLNQRGGIKL